MKFRTEYKATPSTLRLDPQRPLTFIGSCFAEYVGDRLRHMGWDVQSNPCGVLYNPLSIATAIELARDPAVAEQMLDLSITTRADGFVSWFFDSTASGASHSEVVSKGYRMVSELHKSISESQAVFITLGTARVYWHLTEPQIVVGNCHKHPADEFSRRLMSPDMTRDALGSITDKIHSINPDARVIFTVSPVRHRGDGFIDNSVSKATLLIAVSELTRNAKALYFPAYEIMLDDLRDYRFYASDMVHPSDDAIEYILEKFFETYLDADSRALLGRASKLMDRSRHRPISKGMESEKFRIETEQLLEQFRKDYPGLCKS